MRLPRTIRVGPFRFTVISNGEAMNKVCRDEQSDLMGHADLTRLLIHIDPDQAPDQKADTLLHEVLHTITDQTGLRNEWGSEKDEAIVRRVTPILLDTLRRNPTFVAYLTTEVPDGDSDNQSGRRSRGGTRTSSLTRSRRGPTPPR